MRDALKAGLAVVLVALLPWLAVSVADNLQPIVPGASGPVVVLCPPGGCPPTGASAFPRIPQGGGFGVELYLAALIMLFVGMSYYGWRRGMRVGGGSFWNVPAALLVFGFFYVLLLVVSSLHALPLTASGSSSAGGAVGYLSIGFVAFAAATAALWALKGVNRSSPQAPQVQPDGAGRATAAIDRALYSLRGGSDPRSVIIGCYKALTEIFQAKGASSEPAMTAREFEAASESALPVRHEPFHRLTSLFEKARYSGAEVGSGEASEAESVLSELRREIGGGPA